MGQQCRGLHRSGWGQALARADLTGVLSGCPSRVWRVDGRAAKGQRSSTLREVDMSLSQSHRAGA